jgi:hypothetical protein
LPTERVDRVERAATELNESVAFRGTHALEAHWDGDPASWILDSVESSVVDSSDVACLVVFWCCSYVELL